jgi:S1-C subfamily serine protease
VKIEQRSLKAKGGEIIYKKGISMFDYRYGARFFPLLAVGMYQFSTCGDCEGGKGTRRRSRRIHYGSIYSTCAKPLKVSCEPIPPSGRFHRNFIADAVEWSLPSVVRIEVETDTLESGSGSGFFIERKKITGTEESGIVVVTNAHVVLTPEEFESSKTNQNRTILIRLSTGSTLKAQLLLYDTDSDLAILEVDEGNNLKGADISLEEIRHGEVIIALGSPLSLENSVTAGIVSNPRRDWQGMQYIQTDAAIHVGNSGGPMVNLFGQVIGINSLKIAEGISYAIPIRDAMQVLNRLLCKEAPQI